MILSDKKCRQLIIIIIDNKYNLNYYIAPFYNEDLHKNKKSAYLELYENNIIIVFTSGKIVFVDKLKLINDEVFKFVDIANNFSDLNLFAISIRLEINCSLFFN